MTLPKGDNPTEMVQGNLEHGLAVHFDLQRLVVEGDVGTLSHHEEGIQDLLHG